MMDEEGLHELADQYAAWTRELEGDQDRVLGGGRADGHGNMILIFVCGAALDGILHSEL